MPLDAAATAAASRLGTQDLHVHTNMSDGDVPLEVLVDVADDLGVTVGVADHVSSRNMRMFVSTRERLDSYLAALEAAPVLRSAEICWCDPFGASVLEELRTRCDYLVGSNHGFRLPDGSIYSLWSRNLPFTGRGGPDQLMDLMVDNLCDLVGSLPIHIVAHSTLLPVALFNLDPSVDAWWTGEREDRFIDALARQSVAAEISNRYRLPHDRFLRKAREAGVHFSLGSDGHHLNQVARLEWSVATAKRVNIGDEQLFFVERQPRQPA